MFKTIVVAVDGSEHARKAVALASDLADKYGSRLVLLHVLLRDAEPADLRRIVDVKKLSKAMQSDLKRVETVPRAVASAGGEYIYIPVPRDVLEGVGKLIQDDAKRIAARKGVKDVTLAIGEGDPATAILEGAQRAKADVIVLGSRGLSDLKGLFLGSVSHKVSQRAKCTCITVK